MSMITGPVKFSFNTGDIKREALAFWCVMMPRDMFNELGLLDEVFSPGMGEDGDFCIKASLAGHELVQVPVNQSHEFGDDFPLSPDYFPIYHKGSGTFGWTDSSGIIERNKQILNQRYGTKDIVMNERKIKYSIVIPTYNHAEDLLRPCLESIKKYTNMDDVEVIVVANGCTDNTRDVVVSMGNAFKMIWIDEAAGYTKSTNEGIKVARGEYVVLLNNDTVLLEQDMNCWLNMLEEPFVKKNRVGLVGPLQLHDDYADHDVLIFFCVMIKRSLFDEIGLLDEIFSPGGGEDIDFTVRAKQAGYEAVQLCSTEYNGVTNVGNFPIWHRDNKTFGEIPEYTNWIVKRNGLINCKRYNKKIRLNLGGGGVNHPGFLSVDLYDRRAHIKMDITKLDFDDDSVDEIIASHVFEHLNPYHCADILTEWKRVLKPGGKLIMEMPDIKALCASFLKAETIEQKYGILNAVYGSVNTTDVGGPDQITSPHLFGWWDESLYQHLSGTGYENILFGAEQWKHPCDNIRVEANKPAVARFSNGFIDHPHMMRECGEVYTEIFTQNNYNIQPGELEGKTLIDVGANLGYFTLRAIECGVKKVFAVEPEPHVFEGLLNNIKGHNNVVPLNKAMSNVSNETVYIENNHVGSTINNDGKGESVETISLINILTYVDYGEPLVLKMDCEGSEFNILLAASVTRSILRLFDTIYIELHDHTNPDPALADSELIRHKFRECDFVQTYQNRMMNFQTNQPMDIYVEKWQRV